MPPAAQARGQSANRQDLEGGVRLAPCSCKSIPYKQPTVDLPRTGLVAYRPGRVDQTHGGLARRRDHPQAGIRRLLRDPDSSHAVEKPISPGRLKCLPGEFENHPGLFDIRGAENAFGARPKKRITRIEDARDEVTGQPRLPVAPRQAQRRRRDPGRQRPPQKSTLKGAQGAGYMTHGGTRGPRGGCHRGPPRSSRSVSRPAARPTAS